MENVRENRSGGMELKDAVSCAVESCIEKDILADFFREHREEIVEMWEYEFDQEVYDRVLREDGEVIGFEKGKIAGEAIGLEKGQKIGEAAGLEKGKKAIRICQQIHAGNTDNNTIAKACGCTAEEVGDIRKQFGI